MPSPNATPTPITPPRVPLVDSRTGLIDRAWYLFFFSLFNAAVEVYDNPNVAPNAVTLIASYDAALQALTQNVDSQPLPVDSSAELIKQLDAFALENQLAALLPQIAELQKQIDGLQVQPIVDVGAINSSIAALSSAPVTVTADFTVGTSNWYINNKSGSTCTVTLPTASAWVGRYLTFQNYQAQTLVSASSNVVPQAGGAAGTAILLAVAGNWATMVSDGTNWIIMQAASNNCLLLE
jgi:hypothetical protein